jgi:hypothetical protein
MGRFEVQYEKQEKAMKSRAGDRGSDCLGWLRVSRESHEDLLFQDKLLSSRPDSAPEVRAAVMRRLA